MINTLGFRKPKKPLRKLQRFQLESAIFIGKRCLLCTFLLLLQFQFAADFVDVCFATHILPTSLNFVLFPKANWQYQF